MRSRRCTPHDIARYPELALFESDEDRDLACKHVDGTMNVFRWPYIFFLTVGMVVVVFVKEFVPWASRTEVNLFLTFSVIALINLGWARFNRLRTHRTIRLSLNAKGVPVCMNCGYCLQGSNQPRCPECNHSATPMQA